MPDLEISNLPALAEAGVAATDPLAIADISASETKKVTVKDLIEAGLTFIDAASIPAAKSPPNAPANMAPLKKIPRRFASSFRVYHPENKNATPTKKGALNMRQPCVATGRLQFCVLCNAQKETAREQTTKVLYSTGTSTHNTPEGHDEGQIPRRT